MPKTFAEATSTIDAPLELVWRVMLDFDAYAEWNPFIVRAARPASDGGAPLRVGSTFQLHVRWPSGGGASSDEIVTRLEPPGDGGGARLDYDFTGPLHTLHCIRASRTQVLAPLPDGKTRYRTREDFHGLLTFALPIAKVRDGFTAHARALQTRAESIHRAASVR